MSLAKLADARALAQPKPIEVDELMAVNRKEQGHDKFVKNVEGKRLRKVTLDNFDSKLKVGTEPYINYHDWEEMGGYHSNQFYKWPLQRRVWEHAEKKSVDTFYSMEKQEEFAAEDMPLYPLDYEKDILDDFTTVVIGRRRSGKTFLSRWMMYHMRYRFPYGVVITGTRLNNFWSQYVPEESIFDIEDIETVLDQIFARQTLVKGHAHLGIDPRMFVILDDVMGDKYRTRFSAALSNIFTNGRHESIFLLITLQDAKGIPPDLRENTDLCLIFRVYEGGRKKVICEEWLSYIEEMKIEYQNQQNARNNPTGERQLGHAHRVSKQKQHTVLQFFARNTGLMDPESCEKFVESHDTTDEERSKAIPQAIAVLQARTTEDLQMVMKKAVAEDPGPFILGDLRYYKAAATGDYKAIYHTYNQFKRRGARRVTRDGIGKTKKKEDSSETSSSSEEDSEWTESSSSSYD